MEIGFEDEKLETDCNDFKRLVRKHNAQRAKLIRRRLDDLQAAPNLDTMRALPGRCHELKGNRHGQLSIDLDGPMRLIFCSAHSTTPIKEDGGLDWKRVTAITIIEMVNTHE